MRLSLASIAVCVGTSAVLAQEGSVTLENQGPDGAVIDIPGVKKLTIGGQYRLRYENRYNYDFNDDAVLNDDFFAQRFRLNLDLQFNDQMSVFAQFQDTRAWGEETNPQGSNNVPVTTSNSSPGFDMHQVYLQVGDFPGIGGEARVGRQELSYGDQWLVGPLDWANQGRSFDGFRQSWAEEGAYRIDAFITQIRETPLVKTEFDDAYFMGTYASFEHEGGVADVFVLYRYDDMTATAQVENRLTFGARIQEQFGKLGIGAEAATQWGGLGSADIPIGETFAVRASAKLDLGDELPPWIGAEFAAASGDDPNTADNERFDTLYPTGHGILGIMDFVFWENIIHIGASAGIRPTAKTDLQIQWHYFQSMESTDRVFGPAGTLSRGGSGVDSELGHEIDLIYTVKLDTQPVKTSVQLGYGIFMPGQGVLDSLGTDDLAHFVYAQGNVVF